MFHMYYGYGAYYAHDSWTRNHEAMVMSFGEYDPTYRTRPPPESYPPPETRPAPPPPPPEPLPPPYVPSAPPPPYEPPKHVTLALPSLAPPLPMLPLPARPDEPPPPPYNPEPTPISIFVCCFCGSVPQDISTRERQAGSVASGGESVASAPHSLSTFLFDPPAPQRLPSRVPTPQRVSFPHTIYS